MGEIVDRAEPDEHSLILPGQGYEKGSLVPRSADVVPESPRCRDVIVGRRHWHFDHFASLQSHFARMILANYGVMTTCNYKEL